MSVHNHTSVMDERNAEYIRLIRLMFENSPDLITIIGHDHRFSHVNPAYARIHGVSESNLIGREVRIFLGEQTYKNIIRPRLDQCFEGNEIRYENTFQFPGHDPMLMDVRYFPLREHDGSIDQVVIVLRDVTPTRHVSESELYKERLETLVEMAGTVNHEINNPLFTLSGYLELLLQFESDAKKIEYLQTALDGAHRIGKITRTFSEAASHKAQSYPGADNIIEIPDHRMNPAG